MRSPIRSAGRLAVAVACIGVSTHAASPIAPPDSFDLYVVGVRVAELTVTERSGSLSYTIRKRDAASNEWGRPVTADEREAARDTAFLPVWGPLTHLIAMMPSLRDIHWSALRAVGVPDAKTIYVRHGDVHETVNGRTVSAVRWTHRDATDPMDFVFTHDDQLVAAIDPANDFVLVRRGYERFTTVGRWRDAKLSQPMYG